MMKVLMLGQVPKEFGGSYTTGVANVIMNITKELSNNCEVVIYATNYDLQANSDNQTILGYDKKNLVRLIISEFIAKPIKIVREFLSYKFKYKAPALKLLAYRVMIDSYASNLNPDIIHAHGIIFAPTTKYLSVKSKVIFTFHGIFNRDSRAISENKRRGINLPVLYSEGAKLVKAVTYLTKSMAIEGRNDLNIKVDEIVIPNGVDSGKFRFNEISRKAIRDQHGIKPEDLVFISVGALTTRKNHSGFIHFLLNNNIDGHYWIIGKEGEEKENLDRLISEKGLQEKVKIFPYVEHSKLFEFYSAADIYAHPSTSEGQALVVLEAMCTGLPILVNKEITDTLGMGKNLNTYIEEFDIDTNSFVFDSSFYNVDRTLLGKLCAEQFSWSKVAQEYYRFYKNIIEN